MENEIRIGLKQDDFPKNKIRSATFHPKKDIWYIYTTDGWLVIITDKVVTSIEKNKSKAFERFLKIVSK